ncbi:MAG: UDP-3-O-(3-hydroxymyristoyl)glucosamine N-acyltransferase [Myxococcota bacterium]|nr:UDP-3-O-(3-hydroxymyristoyl)glucosamine N-acyltransferase [Myxococcota bacterium]
MPSLGHLAEVVGGKVVGDHSKQITGVAELNRATRDHLSFFTNKKYKGLLATTQAGGLLLAQAIPELNISQLISSEPYVALAKLVRLFHPSAPRKPGITPGAYISPTATLSKTASIGPAAIIMDEAVIGDNTIIEAGAYVGRGVAIGSDCFIHPGTKLLDGSILGNRVVIQSGSVIGSDGFGFASDSTGKHHKIPQVGIVIIEDDVEIGANVTIDRAALGATQIGRGTKIDNLVQIAHNVRIGQDCVIVSQAGIAGSTTVGNNVIIGAQAGVVGHIQIEDQVMLAARAAPISNVKKGSILSGTPAMPHRDWLRYSALRKELPKMRKEILSLRSQKKEKETKDHANPTSSKEDLS